MLAAYIALVAGLGASVLADTPRAQLVPEKIRAAHRFIPPVAFRASGHAGLTTAHREELRHMRQLRTPYRRHTSIA